RAHPASWHRARRACASRVPTPRGSSGSCGCPPRGRGGRARAARSPLQEGRWCATPTGSRRTRAGSAAPRRARAGSRPRAADRTGARGSSVVEERRLAFAAQPDVEAVAVHAFLLCYQPVASFLQVFQNWVGRVVEVHGGLELAHETGVQDQEIDMRCPPLARSWPYCSKNISAGGVSRGAAPAAEGGIVEAPLGVGLPDLEHHVVERAAVGLHHAAGNFDRLTLSTRGEVVRAGGELAWEERPERHLRRGHVPRHGSSAAALRPRTTRLYS